MSRNTPRDAGPPPDSPSDVRPLPARPNLEFEHKQAKRLLRQLHEADPDAVARVHARLRDSTTKKPDEFQLSDAQFTIAREYGFTSWSRLVEYFETLVRHAVSGTMERQRDPSALEAWARTLKAEHSDTRAWTIQFLSAYVPRFYGRTADQILASDVTIEDARLATARMYRFPSWEVMIGETRPYDGWQEHDSPLRPALEAMQSGDLSTLSRLIDEHPELLSPAESTGRPRSHTLAREVIQFDVTSATPSRRAYEWLKERIDLTETLNWMLLGHMHMATKDMQRLLDLGADPDWVPPNGYSVLEHVIWRCWNGEIVDLIASRVKPPEGFWISAGLGDADAVKQYVDARGQLSDSARKVRPDFTALGHIPAPSGSVPDDQEIIWEAFLVAVFNQRFAVLDVLIDRGFPVDYMGWGQTVLHLAVGNGWLPMVEYLVRRGADVDLKGWRPHASARELAEERFKSSHGFPGTQRIVELVGGRDPDVLRREKEAQRAKRVMMTARSVEQAFEHAKLYAREKGLAAVNSESMFLGLLHEAKLSVEAFAQAGFDLQKLRSYVQYGPDTIAVDAPAEMTANPELSAILLDAKELAEKKEHQVLNSLHVMHALVRRAPASVVTMIESAGGTKEKLLESIERSLT